MKTALTAILTLLPSMALASEWKMLDDDAILATLAGAHVEFIAARQEFLSSGDTIWDTGEKRLGHWTVNNDKYCVDWPSLGERGCSTVEQMVEDPTRLRFTGPDGKISNGKITAHN